MFLFLYNISIHLYFALAKCLALFQNKAKLFVQGRRNIFDIMSIDLARNTNDIIWFHCASLGEFEQGRPLIEAIKEAHPDKKILLTFFSPSGYEVRKNYKLADYIYYLPMDSKSNAQQFIQIAQPKLAIFVKYEFWYHYLHTLNQKNIPTFIVSAIFQDRHAFFKWHGVLQRKMLQFPTYFFVQNEDSKQKLAQLNISNVSVAGDTRIDQALHIANTSKEYPLINDFKAEDILLIAGSSWKEDEDLLLACMQSLQDKNVKLLIAPHEIHATHIQEIKTKFAAFKPLLFSEQQLNPFSKVMIVDNIGHLAYMYRYADYVWIGGGFNKTGIHNSIEAAVYSKPLTWGPQYERYQEAIDLIACGAAKQFNNGESLAQYIINMQAHPLQKEKAEHNAQQYIIQNKGATAKILAKIQDWF